MQLVTASKIFAVLLLIACFVLAVSAQDMALMLGDGLYDAGNYHDAITEYKRYLLFHPNASSRSAVYYKLGLCYRNMADWDSAIEALKLSADTALSDDVRAQRTIDLAVIYTAKGDYDMSELLLTRLAPFLRKEAIKRRWWLISTVNQVHTSQWEKARTSYNNYVSLDRGSLSEKHHRIIIDLLSEAQNESMRSEKLAKWLSTFIPGLGQMYCGDWRNGVNALSLNAAVASVWITLGLRDRSEAIAVMLLLPRYYLGQRYRAGKIAQERNAQKHLYYQREILMELRKHLKSHASAVK